MGWREVQLHPAIGPCFVPLRDREWAIRYSDWMSMQPQFHNSKFAGANQKLLEYF